MGWEASINKLCQANTFKVAYRRAQRIQRKIEALTVNFFADLVKTGIGVVSAPSLGRYTPDWEPLSDNWIERKGFEDFYFYKGTLESYLMGRNEPRLFGRPQVWLDWNGGTKRVIAGASPKKYGGMSMRGLKIRVIPFPKIVGDGVAEEIVAGGKESVEVKINPLHRALITPFASWFVHYKIKSALKGAT